MLTVNKNRWPILIAFMIAHGVNDGFGWIIPPLLIGVVAELVGIEKAFLCLSVLPWAAAGIIVLADEKPLG